MVSNVSGKRVLVASSMTAGAEVTAPVAKELLRRGAIVHVLSYEAGTNPFKSFGVTPGTIIEKKGSDRFSISTHLRSEALRIVREFNPDVILTGTQIQDDLHAFTLEQVLWSNSGCKSVAVTDTWASYNERFSDLVIGTSREITAGTIRRHLPTLICAIDRFGFDQMVSLGFDSNMLRVTGSPYFEHVVTAGSGFSDSDKQALVERPVFSPFHKKGKLVVFLSDSIESSFPDIGFTEASVLSAFVQVANSLGEEFNVVVRPHPFRGANAKAAFDSCVTGESKVRYVLHNPVSAKGSDPINDYPIELLLKAADVVVGTMNNPLITAAILRSADLAPVVLQFTPNLSDSKYRVYSFLVDRGVFSEALDESSMATLLRTALNGGLVQVNLASSAGSVDRIIDLL